MVWPSSGALFGQKWGSKCSQVCIKLHTPWTCASLDNGWDKRHVIYWWYWFWLFLMSKLIVCDELAQLVSFAVKSSDGELGCVVGGWEVVSGRVWQSTWVLPPPPGGTLALTSLSLIEVGLGLSTMGQKGVSVSSRALLTLWELNPLE